MKKIAWIIGLLLCTTYIVQAKERVIERPPFIAWSSNSLEIDKIVINDTVTTVFVKAYYRPKNWIAIATGSFLRDNNGMLYPIRQGVGITLDEKFWMPDSGEAEFQLLFPPVPESITYLDFSEGDFDGAFKIWGIQLNEKNFRKGLLPTDAVAHKINLKAQLPTPEVTYGKATLMGKVIGFRDDMPTAGKLYLNDPIRWNYAEEVTIGKDGTFLVQTDVITVTPATLVFPFAQVPCLLAPGKECRIIINPTEGIRQQSHLLKEKKPLGREVYFEGYLAELQQELADNSIQTNLLDNLQNIVPEVAGKDLNGIKDYFMKQRSGIHQQIEDASFSRAAKDVLKANTDITTAIALLLGKDILKRAHITGQKLNDEQAKEYFVNTKMEWPDNYFDVFNKELVLNAPVDLYAPDYAYGVAMFSNPIDSVKQNLGTNQGILLQMMEANRCYRSIEDYTPLTAEQITSLEALPSPAYKEMLTSLNNELIKTIEINKRKTGFNVNEVGQDVTNEEVFPSIISKFRGHTLLVDFWATWCGPCRAANKTILPMKEELKDKDIIYLYVTGETSPMGTWQNMITDLHGEHFRVTNAQWEFLMSNLDIQGVPTYFVIDAEGNTTFKQTGFPGADTMKKELLKALGTLRTVSVATVAPVSTAAPKNDSPKENAVELLPVQIKMEADTITMTVNDSVFRVADQMPRFPGGRRALMRYIAENLQFPTNTADTLTRGRVIVSFIVKKSGSIDHIRIEKGLSSAFNKEAKRVVAHMPRWNPGKKNGEAVNIRYAIPIRFNKNRQGPKE